MNGQGPGAVAQVREATLRLMKAGFRTARTPLQLRTLRRFQQAGLPSQLYPAIAYLLTGRLHPRDRAVAARVEGLRRKLAERGSLTVAAHAGRLDANTDRSQLPGVELHSFEEIAHRVSVPMSFGLFLYLCAEGFEAKRILELGACAGISGCYLASAPRCVELITLELSPALADIARENLRAVTHNATVINADFDTGLPAVVGPETAPFDLVWIDGHHEKEATLRYAKQLLPHISPGGLMLFDDINWTPEMREAWDLIRVWPQFTMTVNASRLGMAVLRKDETEAAPQNWQLKRRFGLSSLAKE